MPKITFDTEDYYSEDTLSEMIECETRCMIREYVNEILNQDNGIRNFVYNVAFKEVSDILDKIVPDYKEMVSEKVSNVIDNLSQFDIFYHSTIPQQIIEEAIDEIRPMLKEKARQLAMEKLNDRVNAEQIVMYVCDEFYNIVMKQLCGKE